MPDTNLITYYNLLTLEILVSGIEALGSYATGKPHAFELMVTLDLEVYKAVRRIILPADIEFTRLHKVLQSAFDWKNCHIFDDSNGVAVARLVPFEEDLEYDENATLMKRHTLS